MEDPASLKNKAAAFAQRGDVKSAIDALEKYCRVTPSDALAMSQLGALLLNANRPMDSLVWLRKATDCDPKLASAWNYFGVSLSAIGQNGFAKQAFEKAVELDPQAAQPAFALGRLLLRAGAKSDAISLLRRACTLDPSHVRARLALGNALIDDGLVDESNAVANAVGVMKKGNDFSPMEFGRLLLRLGRQDEAKKYLEEQLRVDPSDAAGGRLLLAAIGGATFPDRASDSLIARNYASRAVYWDSASKDERNLYRAHHLVHSAFRQLAGQGAGFAVLDIGCGTGLVGELVRNQTMVLHGVDLSGDMLAHASKKAIYDELYCSDALALLSSTRAGQYDFVLSAATLIHYGDLSELFGATAKALKPGAHFIFTVFPNPENADEFDVGFAEGGIFVHGQGYITRTASKCGFQVLQIEEAIHEHQNGVPRIAFCVTLTKAVT